MSRLTLEGIAEPVSRDQILRRERGLTGQKSFPPVQLTTSRIGNHIYPFDPYSAEIADHTFIQSHWVNSKGDAGEKPTVMLCTPSHGPTAMWDINNLRNQYQVHFCLVTNTANYIQ